MISIFCVIELRESVYFAFTVDKFVLRIYYDLKIKQPYNDMVSQNLCGHMFDKYKDDCKSQ